jgi:ABC-2 type transport system ATP-binding protein
LLASHHLVMGEDLDASRLPPGAQVIETGSSGEHGRTLVHSEHPLSDSSLRVLPVKLEDLVLAYMARAAHCEDRRPPLSGVRP